MVKNKISLLLFLGVFFCLTLKKVGAQMLQYQDERAMFQYQQWRETKLFQFEKKLLLLNGDQINHGPAEENILPLLKLFQSKGFSTSESAERNLQETKENLRKFLEEFENERKGRVVGLNWVVPKDPHESFMKCWDTQGVTYLMVQKVHITSYLSSGLALERIRSLDSAIIKRQMDRTAEVSYHWELILSYKLKVIVQANTYAYYDSYFLDGRQLQCVNSYY